MAYLELPQNVNFKEISKNKFLSPRTYKILKVKNRRLIPLLEFLDTPEPIRGSEIGSSAYVQKSPYKFMRTQAVNDSYFSLVEDIESLVPCKRVDFQQAYKNDEKNLIRTGDLFYVKGGNVGAVAISTENINSIFSSHLLKLKIKKEYLYYVLAVLKSDFGKIQIEKLPAGSIEGLDNFKKEYFNIIKIPLPNKDKEKKIINYINFLVESIIKREIEIKKKYNEAIKLIKKDIEDNQKKKSVIVSNPSYLDLTKEKRLDTRIYSERLQQYKNLVRNYNYGYFNTLKEAGYNISRGQNLQESNIGKSIYLEDGKDKYYRLILSKNMSLNMTCIKFSYLGNKNKLKILKRGDVIFTCRGYMGKVIIYCEGDDKTITNIDNVIISKRNANIEENITLGFYLSYLRESGVINDISIAGSGADSFTQYHFDRILIPKFQEKLKKEVSKLYFLEGFNEIDFKDAKEDESIIKKSGIYNLQLQLRLLERELYRIIDLIVRDSGEIN